MTTHTHQAARAQLVDAVLEILMNEGPAGVGAIAVARKLDLAPSAPYAYFNDRAEMVDAALEKITQMFLRELHEAERGAETPLDALKAFTEASAGLIPYISVIPRLLVDGAPEHDRWLALIRQREVAVHGELTRLLAAAQLAGQVREDLPAFKLARYYMGIGFQVYGNWLHRDDHISMEDEARELWMLYEGVVVVRPHAMPLPSDIASKNGKMDSSSATLAGMEQEEIDV